MPKAHKPKTVMDFETKELKCMGCKGTFKPVFPVELTIFVKQMKAFEALHKYCK